MFKSRTERASKAAVKMVKHHSVLSTLAGITALSAVGWGVWWARKRRRH